MFFEGKYAKLGAAGFLEAVLSRLVCGGPLASLVERLLMRELDIFHDSAKKNIKKSLIHPENFSGNKFQKIFPPVAYKDLTKSIN